MRLGFGAALLLLIAACAPQAPPAPSAPERPTADLISLSPAITETIAALGAQDRLAGRSDWCNQPDSVRSLPAFGTSLTPALERIAAARPGRILMDGSMANQTEQLAALAPTDRLPWLTVAEVIDSTRKLGSIVGREEAAAVLSARFEPWLRPLPASARSALLLIGDDGPVTGTFWYVKDDSLHGAMLRAAGWRNAMPDAVSTPSLSAEGLLRLDPEVIVLLVPKALTPGEEAERQAAFGRFGGLRAVANRRVGLVADENILSTGPSLLDSAAKLHALLQGWEAP